MRCVICGKGHGKGDGRLTYHHYLWPKKQYRRGKPILFVVCWRDHCAYHRHYLTGCGHHCDNCKFYKICCYRDS